jgi:hypothetical protein
MLCLVALPCGCDSEPEDEVLRSVEFEGSRVAAEISANPDATFYVDLADDISYSFDQSVTTIDWDHFLVILNEVDEPVAMPIFAEQFGLELSSIEYFEMVGESTGLDDPDGFRAKWTSSKCDKGVQMVCDPSGTCLLEHCGDNPDDP